MYQHHGVLENGNARCLYLHPGTGQPDCIAARVLHRLGVSLENLRTMEGKGCHSLRRDSSPLTYNALWILRTAQMVQDTGRTWGEAYATAVSKAKEAGHE